MTGKEFLIIEINQKADFKFILVPFPQRHLPTHMDHIARTHPTHLIIHAKLAEAYSGASYR